MTYNSHSQFRGSKEWKSFRSCLLEDRGYRCELCGVMKKRGLQIHHLYPNDYSNLEPNRFKVLCSSCHKETERLSKRLCGRNSDSIYDLEKWLNLFYPFLPINAQEAVRIKYNDYLSSKV